MIISSPVSAFYFFGDVQGLALMELLVASLLKITEDLIHVLQRSESAYDLTFSFASNIINNDSLQQCFADLLLMLCHRKKFELFCDLARFLMHCHVPMGKVWSDGELLLAAIASNESKLVTILRAAGCPVHRSHLQALAKYYNPSHLDALMIESEYGSTLMDQDLLVALTEQQYWSYVLRKIEDEVPFIGVVIVETCSALRSDVDMKYCS
ncbi:hypothetical protein Y032_0069g339 [Ancylostoma ceylanicum]|nr:hypothetical protein Y032_0069g339 [Ancylostoma ceylanicum]